jgi:NAD(P)-dependent dehydrogenase (short-subunit alcohol dehydrogenase family)
MMTRTCAEDLSKHKIYMNSVDTGWINDENLLVKAHAHAMASNFQTPIDEIDAAARVLEFVAMKNLVKELARNKCKTQLIEYKQRI